MREWIGTISDLVYAKGGGEVNALANLGCREVYSLIPHAKPPELCSISMYGDLLTPGQSTIASVASSSPLG